MKTKDRPIIGVLALQGAFELHRPHLEAAGAKYVEISQKGQLADVDGLILPGGESSVMLKLLAVTGMDEELSIFLKSKPSWGICAGGILMAKEVRNPSQKSYDIIDIVIERNAYGRQLESREQIINNYLVSYIRAPRILDVGNNVEILGYYENSPSWVLSQKSMITTFHPETNLLFPSPWHQQFVRLSIDQK